MQRRGGNGGDPFGFGDPFAGFGDHRSLLSSFFERDPFDDPFFTRPLGSMFGPGMLGSGMFGPSMLGPRMFGAGGGLFGDMPSSGFLQDQAPQPNNISRGPIIQELSSDNEEEEKDKEEEEDKGTEEKGNPRKHSRPSKEPLVEDPDDAIEERRRKQTNTRSDYNRADRMIPQTRNLSFQSSTVTYGGPNGAYYTSSTTRRTGGDGVTLEESKEADTTTRQATHRVSRGIREKGHSITRKLKSDGKVDTLQTLHNLNEDELAGFEDVWKGNAEKHLPGWGGGFDMLNNGHIDVGTSTGRQNGQASSRGWALPSTEPPQNQGPMRLRGKTRPKSSYGSVQGSQ
ncbi:hypothetical protein AAC387_Pa06g0722 [Persea americana]